MSRSADKAAAAMGNVLSARTEPKTAAKKATPRERSKPVRITVDLSPAEHRALKLYAFDQTRPLADVVRVLVQLLDDPAVAENVSRELRRGN